MAGILTSSGFADPVAPGVVAAPSGPQPVIERSRAEDDGQRRAIRGCRVDDDCVRAADRLREFELETFAPAKHSPWMADDADGASGPSLDTPPVRVTARHPRPKKPSDLWPERAWMDDLVLPDLPMVWDERVAKYLEFYRYDPRGRNIMSAWLRDQGRYRDMILEHLRRAHLPEDLLYVAMIESSYDANEYSRAGASGLWQFMPAGGRIYGLEINRWVDERNDPIRSTQAVLGYFADLYQRFGDWHLALTAYNAGYGAVLKAIARYNSNDFWQLLEYENALPWESSIYVPKALATAIVGHNLERFGYKDLTPATAYAFDTVTVPSSVAMSVMARAAGTSVETLNALNPHVRKGRTPPGVRDFQIRVPRGSGEQFAERFAQLRGDWDDVDAYTVSHGERFEDIATTFGVSRRKLRELNGIEHESEVSGGTVLVVPRISEEEKQANLARAKTDLYTSGDPGGLEGEALIVAVPDKNLEIDGKRRVFYRVVTGDTQFGIARAFGVDRLELAKWNGLEPDAHLHPRMLMQAFIDPALDTKAANIALLDPSKLHLVTRGSEEHLNVLEERTGRERIKLTVDKKQNFDEVGKPYGLSARDVARINNKPHDTVLEKGDTVIVYKVVDKTRSKRAADQARARNSSSKKRSSPSQRKAPSKKPAAKKK